MPVADLESTASGWSVASASDIYGRTVDFGGFPSTSWAMAAAFEEGKGTLDVAPTLVWSQDGKVVDLGADVFDGTGQEAALFGSDPDAVEAQGSAYTPCARIVADTGDSYEATLPAGDYEVRVVAFPQVGSGKRATVVSEPVPVSINDSGAHSQGEARGASTIEFLAPAEGQISRIELDRTTDQVSAEMTQRGYSSDTPMKVVGKCEGSDPEAVLPFELVLPSTGDVLAVRPDLLRRRRVRVGSRGPGRRSGGHRHPADECARWRREALVVPRASDAHWRRRRARVLGDRL